MNEQENDKLLWQALSVQACELIEALYEGVDVFRADFETAEVAYLELGDAVTPPTAFPVYPTIGRGESPREAVHDFLLKFLFAHPPDQTILWRRKPVCDHDIDYMHKKNLYTVSARTAIRPAETIVVPDETP